MGKLRTLLRCAMGASVLAGCAVEASQDEATIEESTGDACELPEQTNASLAGIGLENQSAQSYEDPSAPVQPTSGTVEGGTKLTLRGYFPARTYSVKVESIPCIDLVKVDASKLTCVTGKHVPREVDADVVATDLATRRSSKVGTFHYGCPWLWRWGQPASCGAAPPAHAAADEKTKSMVARFQAGHGFTTTGASGAAVDDRNTFVLGAQSVGFRSKGNGEVAHLARRGTFAFDMTNKLPKVWIKVDNVARASEIELHLGSSASDFFVFRAVAKQAQQWATEGDWVALSMPFGGPVVGRPNRAAITDMDLTLHDDGTGPVGVHINGIGLVDEAVAQYPKGVVSFTFDDGYASQESVAAPILKRAGFAATAYLIHGLLGTGQWMSVAQAHTLENDYGWDIAVHSYLTSVHTHTYPATPEADLEQDIVSSRAWLMNNGFHGYDHCAYPHGSFTGNSDVLSLTRRYFTSCRTIFSTTRENVTPSDAQKLRTYLVSSTTPFATVKMRVDDAVAHHEWLILVLHNLTSSSTLHQNDYSTESFQMMVDYVKATGTAVKPVSRVLAAD